MLRLQIEYLLVIAVSDDILDLINKWVGQIKVYLQWVAQPDPTQLPKKASDLTLSKWFC